MSVPQPHFNQLFQTHPLPQGAALISLNGAYYATLRDDGSLYVYVSNHFVNQNIVWSSETSNKGEGPYILRVQDDGNLVVYDKNMSPTWSSNTWHQGQGPYRLEIESNGNLALIDSNETKTWQSNTQR